MTGTITRDGPNPFYNPSQKESRANPKTVSLEFSTRDNNLLWMVQHGQLDEIQFQAAKQFQALYERAGHRGPHSVDLDRAALGTGNGSNVVHMPSVAVLGAIEELGRMESLLGRIGYRVVCLVAGAGFQVRDAAAIIVEGEPTKQEKLYYSRLFKDHVDILAHEFGLLSKKR